LWPRKEGESGEKLLYARFREVQLSPQHRAVVTDLLKAAGLAVMARTIAEAPQPLSAIENLCGWLDGVPLDEPADAPTGRRLAALSGDNGEPVDVLDVLLDVHRQKASHLVQAIRLAHIEERARAWLGAPKQVTGAARQVPIAYVLGEQGRVDETLVVDIVEPGTIIAFQHADHMLLLPPAGTQPQAASDQPQSHGFSEMFITSMRYAFTTACDWAGCQGVDARWRLRCGAWPKNEGEGASASGQALRAFYGALTAASPGPGVVLLA